MTTRVRNGTGCQGTDLDKELSEVLLSISIVSKRIADRLNACSKEKLNMEGDHDHGKSKRIVCTYR